MFSGSVAGTLLQATCRCNAWNTNYTVLRVLFNQSMPQGEFMVKTLSTANYTQSTGSMFSHLNVTVDCWNFTLNQTNAKPSFNYLLRTMYNKPEIN